MLGGISGHAGLFATANDLMKLMELYRRMGEYGGEQIIAKRCSGGIYKGSVPGKQEPERIWDLTNHS